MRYRATDAEWDEIPELFTERPLTYARFATVAQLQQQEQHLANFQQTNRYIAYFDATGTPQLVTLTPEAKR